ncbi:Mov34/MPN/PAD-1 family protein [Gluconobacter sp. Dm-74]|nr:Mov34/MPN/PAD-1 family protein [Gluconobacter sp. Dm-74]
MTRCADQREAGGILLGHLRGTDIEVVGRTTPGSSDLRSLFSFERSDPQHQEAADDAWMASGGTQTWVGEWHTHPCGNVLPSDIDLRTWRKHARTEKRPMVFVLVVPSNWGVFLVMPYLFRTSIMKLEQLEYGTVGRVFANKT